MTESKQYNKIHSVRQPWLVATASWLTMLILLFGALDSCALGPIRDRMDTMQADIVATRAEISAAREDIGANRAEISATREDIGANRAEISAIRGDIREIHDDIGSLREDIKRLDDRYYNHILNSHTTSGEPTE